MPLPRTPQELAFHVDRHGVLAVPAVFWVGLLILSRQWVLLLLVGLSSRRDGGQSAALVAGASVPWLALAGQTLALLVAAAAFCRMPSGGRWARWVWRHAPKLLLGVALLNALALLPQLGRWQSFALWPDLFLASCSLLDAAVVAAVFTAPYYRQMFQEFPAPAQSGR
jgi:hypothetical protein